MTYACGRELGLADQPAVKAGLAEHEASGLHPPVPWSGVHRRPANWRCDGQ